MSDSTVASPCIGVCRLEQSVCVGCGRRIEEISCWPAAGDAERQRISDEAAKRLAIIRASQFIQAASP